MRYIIRMKNVTGIIAELNPLHNGHEALISSAVSKSEACIVILSSNFTQRGSPAITGKFTRAAMAVNAGADLVIELPFLFACSAGQDFARGAVGLLARTHIADRITFGMENPEYPFSTLLDALDSPEYSRALRQELGRGASYPKASALALECILPGSSEFISKPNNMLAVSYMREIRKNHYGLEVMPVKRDGAVSSRIIREDMRANLGMIPQYSRELLLCAECEGRLCDDGRLWPLLQGVFIRNSAEDLRKVYGIDEGIEGLMLRHWRDSKGLDDFIGRCVCARYTRAHIRRRLIYILLGLDRWEVSGALRAGVPYARVLAFNAKGRKLLRECADRSEVKVITRLADAEGRTGKYFAGVEFRASQLYELLMNNSDMNRETHRVLQFP